MAPANMPDIPAAAALAMGHEITVDQKVRDIQNKAAQRKLLAAYQNVHGIKAVVMQRTIDNLIKANKWVRVGGAANDIGCQDRIR